MANPRKMDGVRMYKLLTARPESWSDTEFLLWAGFHKAIHEDDLVLLAMLIEKGLDVNLQWYPFKLARTLVVDERKTYFNIGTDRCGSPLHEVAYCGSLQLMQILVANGANCRIASLNGSTALHESVAQHEHKITSFLIEHEVDVNQKVFTGSPYGEDSTALQIACRWMDLHVVHQLLKSGAIPEAICVSIALENYDIPILQVLLFHGAALDLSSPRTRGALAEATWKGHMTIESLLSGVSPISTFVDMGTDQIEDMLHEAARPLGALITNLRKSLRDWFEQPTSIEQACRDKICSDCYHSILYPIPTTSYDERSLQQNECPLCRIISDEKLWYRNKAGDHGWSRTLEPAHIRMQGWPHLKNAGQYNSFTDAAGHATGGLARILDRLQECEDVGTECEGTLALAKAWLLQCLTDHAACSASIDALPPLPTRVIDVGSIDRDPKIVITDRKPGTYCALSYCWGRGPFLCTTRDTLAEHKKSIPLARLPKTLRDAVIVTRSLAIQYIWIDALCILQDDESDWAHEASLMAATYRNAVLTIVAAAANETSKGCFQPRTRNRVWPVKRNGCPEYHAQRMHRSKFPSNLTTNFCGRRAYRPEDRSEPQRYIYIYPENGRRGVGPLEDRAWCAQETFLSRRILYFSHELYWECRFCSASEARPGGSVNKKSHSAGTLPNTALMHIHPVGNEVEKDKLLREWEVLVENYAKRSITKQSDRLIALAGIASVVGNAINSEFFAGLWKGQYLGRSLLWQIRDLEPDPDQEKLSYTIDKVQTNPSHQILPLTKPELVRNVERGLFPSWCWASCLAGPRRVTCGRWDDPSRTSGETSRTPIEVADILSSHVDNIFTSNVIHGTIVISGKVRKMRALTAENHTDRDDAARNYVKIVPAEENITEEASQMTNFEDYQLSESPPTRWDIPYEIINETAPKDWLDHLNENLSTKQHERSHATKSLGLSIEDPTKQAFSDDLFSRLSKLSDLKIQQDTNQKIAVPVSKRQHYWIKDHLDLSNEQVWCLPIAFWDGLIVGLCLEPTMKAANEFRRVGLCNIERSGREAWDIDVVFESWRGLESTTVSVI